MKTYSREDWEASLQAWDDGGFSEEWRTIRHVMAMQGCIFPPAEDMFDSCDDREPSQRAVLVRALRETPELLRRCTRNAKTWSQVIDRLFAARDEWREDLNRDEEQAWIESALTQLTHKESVMVLSRIIKRIGDSA